MLSRRNQLSPSCLHIRQDVGSATMMLEMHGVLTVRQLHGGHLQELVLNLLWRLR